MKYHACRRHIAAIAPAEISASLKRQRQLAKIARVAAKGNPTCDIWMTLDFEALDYVMVPPTGYTAPFNYPSAIAVVVA
jgi:hypothetical protein